MNIILGGTGKVGFAIAHALLRHGEPVTLVTRNAAHASTLQAEGATIAQADIHDVERLRDVFRTGTRAFLLNPPADPSTDTDKEEHANVAAIIEVLDGAGLQKLLLASTYGARPGERCGDLTVLHEFEELLRAQPIPVAINRGAYYMSNWTAMLDAVRESGSLPSFFPSDLAIPMVAPQDLGEMAARRLITPEDDRGIVHVEGPARYTPRDVATAFADALGMPVNVQEIPRDSWEQTFLGLGFSKPAASSYACMTATVVDEVSDQPTDYERGPTTLREFIHQQIRDRPE